MRNQTSLTLGEIMASKLGSVDPSRFPDESFDLYSIPAYDAGIPDIAQGSEVGSTKQIVAPNDILLSKIVPHIRRTWIVGEDRGRRLIASGEWIVFRSDKVVPEYLRQLLRADAFHAQFMQTVSGVGGSLLRARPARVAQIRITLPSLAEQRRIAAILDKVDALRAKRREMLTYFETLKQAVFEEFWKSSRGNVVEALLGEIADKTRGSFVNGPFGSDLLTSELQLDGIPVVYIRDIRNGEYLRVSKACVSEEKAKALNVCEVGPGDVLVAKVGDPPGIAAIYPSGQSKAIITQDVIRIRVDQRLVVPEFIQAYLNSALGRLRISEFTVAATRARFSLGDFKKMRIELPPLAAQQCFARKIEQICRIKHDCEVDLAKSDSLFASVQHDAFTGAL